MQILVIYGIRFEQGEWRLWEHNCGYDEIVAVLDSAIARTNQDQSGQPTYMDYFEGSRYIFDVAYGSREQPVEGDTRVYGVRADRMLVGDFEGLKAHFARRIWENTHTAR